MKSSSIRLAIAATMLAALSAVAPMSASAAEVRGTPDYTPELSAAPAKAQATAQGEGDVRTTKVWTEWMQTRTLAQDTVFDIVANSMSWPDIDGNTVVWSDTVDSAVNWNVYAFDLRTNTARAISTAAGNQTRARVSGNWVVWIDSRFGDANHEIYAYNLSTNTEKRITNRAGNQTYPDISGNRVVYEDNVDGTIHLYDLSKDTDTMLPLGAGTHWWAAISGNRVVYTLGVNNAAELYVIDLTTNVIQRLTTHNGYDAYADIDGTVVAWEHDTLTGDTADVLCRDLSKDTTATVLMGGGGNQWYPRVDGYKVVCEDLSSGNWNVEIGDAQLDLAVPLTTDTGHDELPAIDGNSIVWASGVGTSGTNGGNIELGRLAGTTLSVKTSASTCNYGGKTTISGTLADNGYAMANRSVYLEKSTDGGHTWSQVAAATTNTSGAYSFTTPANTTKTHYRTRFDGVKDAIIWPLFWIDAFSSRSSAVSVLPKAYLTKPSSVSKIKHGKAFTVAGYLKPKHTAGTKPVKIQVYKKVSGKWKLKATYSATASNYSSYTKYRYTNAKLATTGSWRMRAYYPASSTNAATYSGWKYVTSN